MRSDYPSPRRAVYIITQVQYDTGPLGSSPPSTALSNRSPGPYRNPPRNPVVYWFFSCFSVLIVWHCLLSCVVIKWTVYAIVIAVVIVARLIWVMGSQTTRVV